MLDLPGRKAKKFASLQRSELCVRLRKIAALIEPVVTTGVVDGTSGGSIVPHSNGSVRG